MDALTNPSAKAFTDMVKPVDHEQLVHRIITGLGIFGGLFALISTLVWMWPSGSPRTRHRATRACRPRLW